MHLLNEDPFEEKYMRKYYVGIKKYNYKSIRKANSGRISKMIALISVLGRVRRLGPKLQIKNGERLFSRASQQNRHTNK